MNIRPTELLLNKENELLIRWSDGQTRKYRVAQLRGDCPCATCREKRSQPAPSPTALPVLPVLSAAEAQPLKLLEMKPLGNYAYGIRFSDGHDTGIFSFELLRQLGEQA